MKTPHALAERLRAATGPYRELDAAIAKQLLNAEIKREPNNRNWRMGHKPTKTREAEPWVALPSYTASVDDALALVERCLPGCAYRIQRNLDGKTWAELQRRKADEAIGFDVWCESDFQATAPIAILICLLTALSEPNHE